MRNPSSSSSKAINKKKSSNGRSGTSAPTPTPCCSKVGMKRGPWTPEEDEVLANYIRKEGEGRWRTLPKRAGLLRCGKSCRLRWMNYLRPSVKRGQIASDEEDLILRLHRLLGNRWSLIAGRIPGRTDNEIKNYWNTHLSKKLISQGIDPRTHKPLTLTPNPPSSSTTPPPHRSSKHPPIVPNRQTPSTSTHHPNHEHHHAIPNNPHHLITVNQDQFDPNPKSSTHDHDHLDHQYQQAQAATGNIVTNYAHDDNLNNPAVAATATHDVSATGLIRSNDHLLTANNEDYDDINYCSDDVFSSFLNSLINEDAFAAQHHLQSEPPTANGHNIALPSDDRDPLVSITTAAAAPPAYGLAVAWESPLMSATFTQNNPNPKTLDDHDE